MNNAIASFIDDGERVVVCSKAFSEAVTALRRMSMPQLANRLVMDAVIQPAPAAKPASSQRTQDDLKPGTKGGEKAWEYFLDTSYFDWWSVRRVGERRWGHCYHVPSQAEAIGLCERLNQMERNALRPVGATGASSPAGTRP